MFIDDNTDDSKKWHFEQARVLYFESVCKSVESGNENKVLMKFLFCYGSIEFDCNLNIVLLPVSLGQIGKLKFSIY